MRGKRNIDRNTRKFISIPDTQKWKQIDELMAMEKYEKSFNKVINEALDYGLPLLLKEAKGEVTYESETEKYDEKQVEMYYRLDELLIEIVNLLEEVTLNEIINKSIVSSLFNDRVRELGDISTSGKMLAEGLLRDTPKYLENYERAELRRLSAKRRETENRSKQNT